MAEEEKSADYQEEDETKSPQRGCVYPGSLIRSQFAPVRAVVLFGPTSSFAIVVRAVGLSFG